MSRPRSPQFGAVLFRATELIAEQGARAFDRLGIELPAGKISLVLAIARHGPMSSSQLADHIGHSRQLIESKLKPSVAAGYFISRPDPDDSRRRIYDFSDSARPDVDRILEVMTDFEAVYEDLWAEIGVDLEIALGAMERALGRATLSERLMETFPKYRSSAKESAQ